MTIIEVVKECQYMCDSCYKRHVRCDFQCCQSSNELLRLLTKVAYLCDQCLSILNTPDLYHACKIVKYKEMCDKTTLASERDFEIFSIDQLPVEQLSNDESNQLLQCFDDGKKNENQAVMSIVAYENMKDEFLPGRKQNDIDLLPLVELITTKESGKKELKRRNEPETLSRIIDEQQSSSNVRKGLDESGRKNSPNKKPRLTDPQLLSNYKIIWIAPLNDARQKFERPVVDGYLMQHHQYCPKIGTHRWKCSYRKSCFAGCATLAKNLVELINYPHNHEPSKQTMKRFEIYRVMDKLIRQTPQMSPQQIVDIALQSVDETKELKKKQYSLITTATRWRLEQHPWLRDIEERVKCSIVEGDGLKNHNYYFDTTRRGNPILILDGYRLMKIGGENGKKHSKCGTFTWICAAGQTHKSLSQDLCNVRAKTFDRQLVRIKDLPHTHAPGQTPTLEGANLYKMAKTISKQNQINIFTHMTAIGQEDSISPIVSNNNFNIFPDFPS